MSLQLKHLRQLDGRSSIPRAIQFSIRLVLLRDNCYEDIYTFDSIPLLWLPPDTF